MLAQAHFAVWEISSPVGLGDEYSPGLSSPAQWQISVKTWQCNMGVCLLELLMFNIDNRYFTFCNSVCAIQAWTKIGFFKKRKWRSKHFGSLNWAEVHGRAVFIPLSGGWGILWWFVLGCWTKTAETPGCYFFVLISVRNRNYLWHHLIVTINKIYSAALQPFAFFRPAL